MCRNRFVPNANVNLLASDTKMKFWMIGTLLAPPNEVKGIALVEME
jgi:hypothetical protein